MLGLSVPPRPQVLLLHRAVTKKQPSCTGVGGAFIGSMIVFKVTEALGTRREMLVAAFLFVVGGAIEYLSSGSSLNASSGISVLLLGRWTYGVGCGFAMHGAPSYIAELSPPDVRGALVSMKEGMVVLGMLLGYIVGFVRRDTPGGWGLTYGVSIVPAVAFVLGVSLLPSPPRWLVRKGADKVTPCPPPPPPPSPFAPFTCSMQLTS